MKNKNLNIGTILIVWLYVLFPSKLNSENPEWMYFFDIIPFRTIASFDNEVYITTNDAGIERLIRMNLEDFSLDTIIQLSISSVAKDANGDLWMSTRSKGVLHLKDGAITEYNSNNSGMSHNVVFDIAFDQENNLWCATINGLSKFDGQKWQVFRTEGTGQHDNSFLEVKIDKDGSTWHRIPTYQIVHRANGKFQSYNSENTSTKNLTYSHTIGIDKRGNKWFASGYYDIDTIGGLIKYDNSTWVEYNNQNSELPDNQLVSLAIDSNGVVWVGGIFGGLIKFDGSTWKNYTTTNSDILGNTVTIVCSDKFNNKWLNTLSLINLGVRALSVFREGGVLLPTSAIETIEKLKTKEPLVIPNPAENIICVTDIVKRERKYKISNFLGQVVLEGVFYHDIDVSSLATGFYFLNVDDFNLKFIKK